MSRRALLTVLLLALITLSASVEAYRVLGKGHGIIQPQSAHIAARMLSADCCEHEGAEVAPERNEGASFSVGPGYALMLFGIAKIDERAAAAITCQVSKQRCDDDGSLISVVVVQLVLAVLGLVCVFGAAWRLSGSWEVAMFTLILAFLASRVGEFAALFYPIVWPPFLAYLTIYLTVEALTRGNVLLGAGAGLSIGAAGLFMPLWLIMAPVAAAVMVIAPALHGQRRRGLMLGAALLAGTASAGLLVLYAQSLSYDPASLVRQLSVQLSERVAFQAMDLNAWLASLMVPVPILGGLAEPLFGEATTKLFGLWREGTYTHYGSTVIYGDALKSSNAPLQQYAWLVDTYIWGDFGAYLASTVSTLNRGVWADAGLIGLAGLFQLHIMLSKQKADGNICALTAVALPIVVLFLSQALLTANHQFNNPGLTFLYCYAIAYVSASVAMELRRDRSACSGQIAGGS